MLYATHRLFLTKQQSLKMQTVTLEDSHYCTTGGFERELESMCWVDLIVISPLANIALRESEPLAEFIDRVCFNDICDISTFAFAYDIEIGESTDRCVLSAKRLI